MFKRYAIVCVGTWNFPAVKTLLLCTCTRNDGYSLILCYLLVVCVFGYMSSVIFCLIANKALSLFLNANAGSGKTMTLFSALRALPDMEVVGLNFSSATTPELLLKTFDHYCEYKYVYSVA